MRLTKPVLSMTVAALLLVLAATVALANITLTEFIGSWTQEDLAELQWTTGDELETAGFYVWRSTQDLQVDANRQIDTSQATRISELIPANSPCSQTGHTYSYDDTTVDVNQGTYYYYLEGISCQGDEPAFYGDLGGTGGLQLDYDPTRYVYMPLILRN